MPREIPDIKVVRIDLESVEDDPDIAEALLFDVVLSSEPEPLWAEEFEILYRQQHFAIKPPVALHDDRIRVHFLPRYGSELQSYIDFLIGIVRLSNDETHRTEALKSEDSSLERRQEFRAKLAQVRTPIG